MAWAWTFAFSALLAVVFTILGFLAFARGEGAWRNVSGWLYWYGKNFTVTLVISAVIHLLFDLARATVAPPWRVCGWRSWQRTLFFTGVPLLGVALGWPVGVWLAGADMNVWIGSREGNNIIAGTVFMSVMITFLLHHYFSAKAQKIEAEHRATEAQLRLLQAQIEPHFLFNTLANVHSLIDHDAAKAKAMLGAFTDYLRASLVGLRREEVTLADELALAEAYLRVQASRMEDRLNFRIEVDDTTRRATLLPLLLQPLVENAVHHGLEPKVEGGSIAVCARTEGNSVVVEVRDDGSGLGGPARKGAGMALANVRERLAARFGSAASLTVAAAQPGTLATLRLPLSVAPSAALPGATR
ncbi:MAG: histidine kinase [Rubrivivax sp.]|nr:histidine kinase [Rubrivivax sp.]